MGPSKTTIVSETVRLPMAELGADSPLPPLPTALDVHASVSSEGVPEEVARNLNTGFPASMLPYTTQNGYGRERHDGELPAVVVDNGLLRATFIPSLGGRLWSLVDQVSGRELLYRNPVLQPADLALRGAWFSGGVEWNLGTTGHTPLTCAPMHAAELEGPDGPVLRMWEFERLREVTYQLDVSLPPGSTQLVVAVRIVNPNRYGVPMYWWSNTAVPDTPGNRVIAPAVDAYRFSYERMLKVVPTPEDHGIDYSYPENSALAADYFFRCTDTDRPWIAAVDASGFGLVQTSTARLQGRKLFVWGTGTGGRRWQEWLTEPGTGGYLEIQAGLARTQMEHLPMPAESTWSWVETYGPIDVPRRRAHHRDWRQAVDAVEEALGDEMSAHAAEARYRVWKSWFDAPVRRILHRGSGWGALEQARRTAAGEPGLQRPGTPFGEPDPDDAEIADWLSLLNTGRLPSADPGEALTSYATSSGWRRLLEDSPPDWLSFYHRGLAAVAAGDDADAMQMWEVSLRHTETAWAHRALGQTWRRRARDIEGNAAEEALQRAGMHYRRAVAIKPRVWQLVVEACDALFDMGADGDALEIIEAADTDHGQLTMRRIKALTRLGRLGEAQRLFDAGFEVANLREGEETLDALWLELAERRVADGGPVTDEVRSEARRRYRLPTRYNFRMTPLDDLPG